MKRLILFICLGLFLGVGPLAAQTQEAAPSQEEKIEIAVIDVQRILQESLAATSVQKQLEAQREMFQTEIAQEETELRESEKALAKLRNSATAEQYSVHEEKLRNRFLTVERHVQAKRKALDQAFTDSMDIVRQNLLKVVEGIAAARNVKLVLVKQQALWSDARLDITDEVLSRLNTALPEVKVKINYDENAPLS